MPGFEWFGDEERKQVNEVLETGILMRYNFENQRKGRWKAVELENELAEKLDVKHVHVCSSGTAALQIALACLGIGAEDEVIMPTFTFVATFEAILSVGATPVLADVEDTLSLSVASIQSKITPKTKAIMLVHMCGTMAEVDKIQEFCQKNNLILIEDACQVIGGTFKGKALGTFGTVGCYSMDYVKTITCGEGGAVFTNDTELYTKIQAYSDHGHDHIGNDRGAESHPLLGLNFRISELHAAVGLAQLSKLDKIIETQKINNTKLKLAFKEFPQIQFRRIPDLEGENASFLSVFLPTELEAKKLSNELKINQVDSFFYWYSNNWHYYKKWEHLQKLKMPYPINASIKERFQSWENFPLSDQYLSRTISFAIKLSWTEEEIQERISRIKKSLRAVFL